MSVGRSLEDGSPKFTADHFFETSPEIGWRAKRVESEYAARLAEQWLNDPSVGTAQYRPTLGERLTNFAIFPGPFVAAGIVWAAIHPNDAMQLVNILVKSIGGPTVFVGE